MSLTVEILKLYCRYCLFVFCCYIIFNFYIILAFTKAFINSFSLSFCKNQFFLKTGLSNLSGVFLKSFNLDCGYVFTCFDSISFFFMIFFLACTGLSFNFSKIFFKFSLFWEEDIICYGLIQVLILVVWLSRLEMKIVLDLLVGCFSVRMLYYGFECILLNTIESQSQRWSKLSTA